MDLNLYAKVRDSARYCRDLGVRKKVSLFLEIIRTGAFRILSIQTDNDARLDTYLKYLDWIQSDPFHRTDVLNYYKVLDFDMPKSRWKKSESTYQRVLNIFLSLNLITPQAASTMMFVLIFGFFIP